MNSQSVYGSRKASLALDIIVVGCGLGGLGAAFCLTQAGHRVTIVESSPVIGEVGAGIQVSPNSSRLLRRWGLGKELAEIAVKPEAIVLRRYNTGERVGYTKVRETMERDYGSPYYHIHRADFHKLLYGLVAPHVTLLLDSTVVGCDPGPGTPSVTLKCGRVLKADLIVGADGVKSFIQRVVSGEANPAEPTGDAAYRATIPASLMIQDPELRGFIDHPQMTGWMAPGRHLMAYPIRRKEEFNLVLLHPDDGSVESWTAEGSAEKMRRDFSDFEPRVGKLLGLVQSTLKWRLMDRKPLKKWIHKSGRVILLGDACHPMLPYRAQGAAMAIEDAAVLGNLLSRISHISQLEPLLKAYQDLRLPRTAIVQESSRLNQRIFHLPDGPEQRERDENMRKAMALELAGKTAELQRESVGNQNQWADKSKSDSLFGYDADAEVDKWWASHGKELRVPVRSKL